MTENKPQKTCITSLKKWCIDFYKAPCFWLKVIPLLIVIGLAVFGLFQITTSAFHYFSEPLSFFDPERLGQLGDFLGGTLNPIFGFATICLLLWSVFIQRKELSLTRLELGKSSAALHGQLQQAHNESTRYQLGQLLEQEYKRLENIFSERFNATGNEDAPFYREFWAFKTLREIAQEDLDDEAKIELSQLFENFDPTKSTEGGYEADFAAMWLTMFKASATIKTITEITKDILGACELEPVERFWFMRWYDALNKCHTVGVVGEQKYDLILKEMQTARISKNTLISKTNMNDKNAQ
jgi:hypothetical protein